MTKTVRLNGTIDRTRGFFTPSESDYQCPFFRKRFFEHGPAKERRAVCEMKDGQGFCDYKLLQEDGTPICARYVHSPNYEIDADTGEMIDDTFEPIPYIENTMVQDDDGELVPSAQQWLTNDFVDTHEKRFRLQDSVLGWFHDV